MNDTQEKLLELMQKANPLAHNNLMCEKIKQEIQDIPTPLLTDQEIDQIKKHLNKGYEKIIPRNEKEKLQIKFLNLRNIFLTVIEFETNIELRAKIKTILRHLQKYDYIFQLINENNTLLLDKALNNLNLPINKFIIKYGTLLQNNNITPNYTPLPTNQDEEEPKNNSDDTITIDDIPDKDNTLHDWQ